LQNQGFSPRDGLIEGANFDQHSHVLDFVNPLRSRRRLHLQGRKLGPMNPGISGLPASRPVPWYASPRYATHKKTTAGLARRRAVNLPLPSSSPASVRRRLGCLSAADGVRRREAVLQSLLQLVILRLSRWMCCLGFCACLSGGAGSNFSVILSCPILAAELGKRSTAVGCSSRRRA
jgi:hypothetical protein